MPDLRIIHSSLQFSDTRKQQEADVRAVYGYARKRRAIFLAGTEAGGSTLHELLVKHARAYGFGVFVHGSGEWVATNLAYAKVKAKGFVGPLIPSTAGSGLKASQGAHSARGIAWQTARYGDLDVTMGVSHFLTDRSEKVSGSNAPLIAGIGSWGRDKGQGKALVFFSADVNENDQRQDVFKGQPFTTCWDELRKWPGTHGSSKVRGSTIDVIASYDRDGRVSAKAARSVDDSELQLNTDHFLIEATYSIRT